MTILVLIDFQKDFCDPSSLMYVSGARGDCSRISKFININQKKIDKIFVTLDSHHLLDVAHPLFWQDKEGNHPAYFTKITLEDFIKGVWTPTMPDLHDRMHQYLYNFKANGKYELTIWPPHCLIGSSGQTIEIQVDDDLYNWQVNTKRNIIAINKGMNIYTENYSAIQADVIDKDDPTTDINMEFIKELLRADSVIFAGEASSHCVKFTVEDVMKWFTKKTTSKLSLLTDAMSPVKGYDKESFEFFNSSAKAGVNLITTETIL